MVGDQWLAWGATPLPWTGSTGRHLVEECQWTIPLTPCPETTTTDLQGVMTITELGLRLRPTQALAGALTWTIATGTILVEMHVYVTRIQGGVDNKYTFWLDNFLSRSQPLLPSVLQTGSSRRLQNAGSKLQSHQQEPTGPLCCSATGMFSLPHLLNVLLCVS